MHCTRMVKKQVCCGKIKAYIDAYSGCSCAYSGSDVYFEFRCEKCNKEIKIPHIDHLTAEEILTKYIEDME